MKSLMMVALVCAALLGCNKTDTVVQKTVSASDKPDVITTEYKFASISAGHLVDKNSPEIARAKMLLTHASAKFNSSPESISDEVVTIKNLADQEGIKVDMFALLESIPVIEPRAHSDNKRFVELLSYYMGVRHSGMNHSEALAGLSELVSTSERTK